MEADDVEGEAVSSIPARRAVSNKPARVLGWDLRAVPPSSSLANLTRPSN